MTTHVTGEEVRQAADYYYELWAEYRQLYQRSQFWGLMLAMRELMTALDPSEDDSLGLPEESTKPLMVNARLKAPSITPKALPDDPVQRLRTS